MKTKRLTLLRLVMLAGMLVEAGMFYFAFRANTGQDCAALSNQKSHPKVGFFFI